MTKKKGRARKQKHFRNNRNNGNHISNGSDGSNVSKENNGFNGNKIGYNDGRLAKLVTRVEIPNLREIIDGLSYHGSDSLFLQQLSQAYVNYKLDALRQYDNMDIVSNVYITYEGRGHLIEITPNKIEGNGTRQRLDKKVAAIKEKGMQDIGVLYFLPFNVNGANDRKYIKKEIPGLDFVNLPYNPKQILARVYQ